MSEWLNAFLAKPAQPLKEAVQPDHGALCFIIDSIRQPRAKIELHDLPGTQLVEALFKDTEFSDLLEHSPLWVVTQPDSEAAELAARLCVQQRSGIVIGVAGAEAGLRQARHLLKVKDAGGFSLARYYDPAVWAGCSLAGGEQAAVLYGPWEAVYSPAVQGRGEEDLWLNWAAPLGEQALADSPLTMTPDMLAASQELRWSYWVYQHPLQFHKPDDLQLPRLIANLRYLAEHGLEESRHLLALADLLSGPPLCERPQVVTILAQGLPPHRAVAELQALSAD
nr:DUF4123 domain-containing protein [uncultured Pseudomonas sp.]